MSIERIVVEATGGYEALVVKKLFAAGLPVARVNPGRVREFARRLGNWRKRIGWMPRSWRALVRR